MHHDPDLPRPVKDYLGCISKAVQAVAGQQPGAVHYYVDGAFCCMRDIEHLMHRAGRGAAYYWFWQRAGDELARASESARTGNWDAARESLSRAAAAAHQFVIPALVPERNQGRQGLER